MQAFRWLFIQMVASYIWSRSRFNIWLLLEADGLYYWVLIIYLNRFLIQRICRPDITRCLLIEIFESVSAPELKILLLRNCLDLRRITIRHPMRRPVRLGPNWAKLLYEVIFLPQINKIRHIWFLEHVDFVSVNLWAEAAGVHLNPTTMLFDVRSPLASILRQGRLPAICIYSIRQALSFIFLPFYHFQGPILHLILKSRRIISFIGELISGGHGQVVVDCLCLYWGIVTRRRLRNLRFSLRFHFAIDHNNILLSNYFWLGHLLQQFLILRNFKFRCN